MRLGLVLLALSFCVAADAAVAACTGVNKQTGKSQAVEAMGCEVTSNMPSLVVLNLPGKLKGKEKELVQGARAQGFGIWPTLSEPVQVRIGILNQLSPKQIGEITSRFADAMLAMGAQFDKQQVMNQLKSYYAKAA